MYTGNSNNTQGCAARLTVKIQVYSCSFASPAPVLILEAGYTVNSFPLKHHVKLAFLEMLIMWVNILPNGSVTNQQLVQRELHVQHSLYIHFQESG